MVKEQLLFIATSKVEIIQAGGQFNGLAWGTKTKWKKFKSPSTSTKTIKWTKKLKTHTSKKETKWYRAPTSAGVDKYGVHFPRTVERSIAGEVQTVDVRYKMRKRYEYTRTKNQKKKGKCTKKVYTYYEYKIQYKDKPIIDKAYSQYVDGLRYVYFSDHYYIGNTRHTSPGQLPHPVEFQLTYSDVRKNWDAAGNINNSESRDNTGRYILRNVRANIVTLDLIWRGLTEEKGRDLLAILNPEKDKNGNYPYLIVQYIDPASGNHENKTFFANDRAVGVYANGMFKEISVKLTEV